MRACTYVYVVTLPCFQALINVCESGSKAHLCESGNETHVLEPGNKSYLLCYATDRLEEILLLCVYVCQHKKKKIAVPIFLVTPAQ